MFAVATVMVATFLKIISEICARHFEYSEKFRPAWADKGVGRDSQSCPMV